jgi:hypothetical protein
MAIPFASVWNRHSLVVLSPIGGDRDGNMTTAFGKGLPEIASTTLTAMEKELV